MTAVPEPSSTLLEGVAAGSVASWQRLLHVYVPVIEHWCRRRGLGPEDIDDVRQDVFRTLTTRIKGFDPGADGSFVAWLFVITRSRIVDQFRRRRGEPPALGGSDFRQQLEAVPQPEDDDPEEGASFELLALRRVLDCVQGEVEPRTWQAFTRVVLDGQSTAVVAAELRMTEGAVRVAKCRVVRRIRDLIE
jgi:RNA polymerase sigma-70 factor, ECF subfamily